MCPVQIFLFNNYIACSYRFAIINLLFALQYCIYALAAVRMALFERGVLWVHMMMR